MNKWHLIRWWAFLGFGYMLGTVGLWFNDWQLWVFIALAMIVAVISEKIGESQLPQGDE